MKQIHIEGGYFLMGSPVDIGFANDLERPQELVKVESFEINQTTVTNRDFNSFVLDTGYRTEAEILGDSFVFGILLDEETKSISESSTSNPWWYLVKGASWRCPTGPSSTFLDCLDHPVVHVSRNDALAYCKWSGQRLPTEAEWEYACIGGIQNQIFPWGNELHENNTHHANVWQGSFPTENTAEDGYVGTAPVYTYEPNEYGLYQMIGNVWEWCMNPAKIPLGNFKKVSSGLFEANYPIDSEGVFAIRGGSFLCHDSYCNRYRSAARNGNAANSTSSNLGFRCVRSKTSVEAILEEPIEILDSKVESCACCGRRQ